MASLKGTQTEKNLLQAFAGESQARNRYTYFSSQAKKEGYEADLLDFCRHGRQREGARQKVFLLPGRRRRYDQRDLPRRRRGDYRAKPRRSGGRGAHGVGHHLPRFRGRSGQGRFPRNRKGLQDDSDRRNVSRKTVLSPLRKHQKNRVFKRDGKEVEMQELRLRTRRPRSPGQMPGLRPSASALRVAWRRTTRLMGTGHGVAAAARCPFRTRLIASPGMTGCRGARWTPETPGPAPGVLVVGDHRRESVRFSCMEVRRR